MPTSDVSDPRVGGVAARGPMLGRSGSDGPPTSQTHCRRRGKSESEAWEPGVRRDQRRPPRPRIAGRSRDRAGQGREEVLRRDGRGHKGQLRRCIVANAQHDLPRGPWARLEHLVRPDRRGERQLDDRVARQIGPESRCSAKTSSIRSGWTAAFAEDRDESRANFFDGPRVGLEKNRELPRDAEHVLSLLIELHRERRPVQGVRANTTVTVAPVCVERQYVS